MFDWTIIGGDRIFLCSLKTKQNKKKFQDPLTETETALCVNLGPKCQNLFPLVSD
jgi:hypothetical protein